MSKKIISAILFVVFSSVFAYAGGVTNIKEVVNRSSQIVRLTTYEDKNSVETKFKTTRKIAAGATWTGEMWIPWADNQEQFDKHFLKIEFFKSRPRSNVYDVKVVTIYQSGEYVRMSADNNFATNDNGEEINMELPIEAYNPNAAKVDGEWSAGGERRIIFTDKPDGSVGFKFEKYTR